MQVMVRNYVSVYIIWLCQTRRIDGAGPAAPPPPAMTSPGPPEAGRGPLSRGSLATCDVLPADRRSNQKETVTCQLPGYQWAIPSQHLVVGTPGRLGNHWNWNCNCCHQYLWPWPQCHGSSESDCQASKQNYFGGRLNFRRRRPGRQI